MNEEDIKVRYEKFYIEFILNTGYVPTLIPFNVGKLINNKSFENKISLLFSFESKRREYFLKNKDFLIAYMNKVMKKSYVRYGY